MVNSTFQQVGRLLKEETFKISTQVVESANDTCISIQSVAHSETEIIVRTIVENKTDTDAKLNKLYGCLALICQKLFSCTDGQIDENDLGEIIGTEQLENGNVAVIFKTGNNQSQPNSKNKSGVQKTIKDKVLNKVGDISKFTMPCLHAMDPECLKNFCRSRLNAGESRFMCPSLGCDVEWRYEVIRRYCNLKKNEASEFEKRISINYAQKAFSGVMECPKCRSLCVRDNPKDTKVACPHCGKHFNFVSQPNSREE